MVRDILDYTKEVPSLKFAGYNINFVAEQMIFSHFNQYMMNQLDDFNKDKNEKWNSKLQKINKLTSIERYDHLEIKKEFRLA